MDDIGAQFKSDLVRQACAKLETAGIVPDDSQVQVAASTIDAVMKGRTKDLTDAAADGLEKMLNDDLDSESVGELHSNMKAVAQQLAPALAQMGIGEERSNMLAKMMTAVSEKMMSAVSDKGDDARDGAGETSAPGPASGGGTYVDNIVDEFCNRVFQLLYKLALYARPLEELPDYAGEPEECKQTFASVLQALAGEREAEENMLASELFQGAYLERLRHLGEPRLLGAELQALLWYDNVVMDPEHESKRDTMQEWHNACKIHYAYLTSKVPESVSHKAILDAIPDIYPLHASELATFWNEEPFASSRNEVLTDLEQINMLSAVISGLPAPMQRIMSKLAETANFDKLTNEHGDIDQQALMQAALDTMFSLSSKETMELMRAMPDMIRGLGAPMSHALQKANEVPAANEFITNLAGQLLSGMSGAGAGVGAGEGTGAATHA